MLLWNSFQIQVNLFATYIFDKRHGECWQCCHRKPSWQRCVSFTFVSIWRFKKSSYFENFMNEELNPFIRQEVWGGESGISAPLNASPWRDGISCRNVWRRNTDPGKISPWRYQPLGWVQYGKEAASWWWECNRRWWKKVCIMIVIALLIWSSYPSLPSQTFCGTQFVPKLVENVD